MSEEDIESPYCEVCGTCGYIGCCGIRNFIEEHIKGKTNCKNEDLIISELIYLCENEEEKDKEIEKLHSIIKEVREMRKYLSNKYYEMGEEVDMGVIIENLDRILDKVEENK